MASDLIMIHELAERAQTTIRTIRYYTDEGLLPVPVTQGKYAYYTTAHLDRLELIRRMKDSFLPLRQIKQVMSSLSDDEVRQKLIEQPVASADLKPENAPRMVREPGGDALEYIAKIMHQQVDYQPKTSRSAPQGSAPRHVSLPAPAPAPTQPVLSATFTMQESWQRISLAPGIELHLREPITPAISQRIQQLVDYARRLF